MGRGIVNSCGAELVSYKNKEEKEFVWCGDPAYWPSHAPLLFPVVGALIEDKISIAGVEYTIPKHGFVRKKEFTLVEQKPDSITMMIASDEESLKQYPHPFVVKVTHTLTNTGFSTYYTVENPTDATMIFCIGGHPGFACPQDGEDFEDYTLVFEKEEDPNGYYTDSKSVLQKEPYALLNGKELPLNYDDYQKDVFVMPSIQSKELVLHSKKQGDIFRFVMDGFPALGIWTPPNKKAPFICLEPWLGLPAMDGESGTFEAKPYATTLMGKESKTVGYTVELL